MPSRSAGTWKGTAEKGEEPMEREKAWAKLNLTLDILGKRPDGYHDLRMVMQSVSLCDELTVNFNGGEGISLHTNLPFLPRDGTNLITRAAQAFFRETGLAPVGMEVVLNKRIPVCAGTAGGSSDGAAMLRVLRRRFAPGLPDGELERIGGMVGSDIPFCLRGGTALAEGRGELLRTLPDLPDCWLVLCKPEFPISTPELFSLVNVKALRYHPDTEGMCRSLESGDLEGVCRRLYNVFEDVLPRKYARVAELKRQLLELGAMGVCMTGSGPTVFGVFGDASRAADAAEGMGRTCPGTYLARPVRGAGG